VIEQLADWLLDGLSEPSFASRPDLLLGLLAEATELSTHNLEELRDLTPADWFAAIELAAGPVE